MRALAQNLRIAFRQLRRVPGFTLTVVLTLALGIGATTAIFSLVEGVLLRPLPFQEADRLVLWGDHWELARAFPSLLVRSEHIRARLKPFPRWVVTSPPDMSSPVVNNLRESMPPVSLPTCFSRSAFRQSSAVSSLRRKRPPISRSRSSVMVYGLTDTTVIPAPSVPPSFLTAKRTPSSP